MNKKESTFIKKAPLPKKYDSFIGWKQPKGRLTVVSIADYEKKRRRLFLCTCDCGNTKQIPAYSVISQKTKSCGCLRSEGLVRRNTTHGESKTRLYRIWDHMIRRCRNPSDRAYKDYGGRGIYVIDEWLRFESFRKWAYENGYAENLTLERVDNDGGYCPENCSWIPAEAQQSNRRNNVRVTIDGQSLTIAELSRKTGINRQTLSDRYHAGRKNADILQKR